jgi:ABC-type transporter Mla maintaining outer membrane lipid asymmetry permease subunit MlaE
MTASAIPAAVAVALALEELDHMKAMECLPCPAVLLARLHARTEDFNMLAGVVAAYLKAQGMTNG